MKVLIIEDEVNKLALSSLKNLMLNLGKEGSYMNLTIKDVADVSQLIRADFYDNEEKISASSSVILSANPDIAYSKLKVKLSDYNSVFFSELEKQSYYKNLFYSFAEICKKESGFVFPQPVNFGQVSIIPSSLTSFFNKFKDSDFEDIKNKSLEMLQSTLNKTTPEYKKRTIEIKNYETKMAEAFATIISKMQKSQSKEMSISTIKKLSTSGFTWGLLEGEALLFCWFWMMNASSAMSGLPFIDILNTAVHGSGLPYIFKEKFSEEPIISLAYRMHIFSSNFLTLKTDANEMKFVMKTSYDDLSILNGIGKKDKYIKSQTILCMILAMISQPKEWFENYLNDDTLIKDFMLFTAIEVTNGLVFKENVVNPNSSYYINTDWAASLFEVKYGILFKELYEYLGITSRIKNAATSDQILSILAKDTDFLINKNETITNNNSSDDFISLFELPYDMTLTVDPTEDLIFDYQTRNRGQLIPVGINLITDVMLPVYEDASITTSIVNEYKLQSETAKTVLEAIDIAQTNTIITLENELSYSLINELIDLDAEGDLEQTEEVVAELKEDELEKQNDDDYISNVDLDLTQKVEDGFKGPLLDSDEFSTSTNVIKIAEDLFYQIEDENEHATLILSQEMINATQILFANLTGQESDIIGNTINLPVNRYSLLNALILNSIFNKEMLAVVSICYPEFLHVKKESMTLTWNKKNLTYLRETFSVPFYQGYFKLTKTEMSKAKKLTNPTFQGILRNLFVNGNEEQVISALTVHCLSLTSFDFEESIVCNLIALGIHPMPYVEIIMKYNPDFASFTEEKLEQLNAKLSLIL